MKIPISLFCAELLLGLVVNIVINFIVTHLSNTIYQLPHNQSMSSNIHNFLPTNSYFQT